MHSTVSLKKKGYCFPSAEDEIHGIVQINPSYPSIETILMGLLQNRMLRLCKSSVNAFISIISILLKCGLTHSLDFSL